MSIDGVSGRTSYIGSGILNLRNQLDTLSEQLASGKVSNTYAGQGAGRSLAIGIRAQVNSYDSFADTATNVNTRINVANLSLQRLVAINSDVKGAAVSAGNTLDNTGQTPGQKTANLDFFDSVDMLNAQSGDRYLFGGRATDAPPVTSADQIMNGNGAAIAGLKQVIAERQAADIGGLGMGRVLLSQPTPTSVQIGEDFAANPAATPPVPASPFGLKLSAVSTTITGATITQPTATPPATTPPSPLAMSVDLGVTNPKDGDTVKFTFKLPDGTSEDIVLTASSATPLPANSFQIDPGSPQAVPPVLPSPAVTAANLKSALTTAVQQLANGPLAAASAVQAGNEFFGEPPLRTVGTTAFGDNSTSGTQVNNKNAVAVTGNTLLSGAAATNSIGVDFAVGNTINVNGTPITFTASGGTNDATHIPVDSNITALLGKIDALSGNVSNPSTVSATGAIVLHSGTANDLTITSTAAGFVSLGLTTPVNVTRNGGATALVAGTKADTVFWYNGETDSSTDPARGTAVARIDQGITVSYGARADEQALRTQLQNVAVFAAVTTKTTDINSSGKIAALNQRIAANLAVIPGTQTIQDIQADFAGAQASIKSTTDRQTQSKAISQNLLDSIEGINNDEVATKILALQTALSASYQTTSKLYSESLVKYL
jgi:flagellin-like hook-associated protein FlgL